MLRHLRVGTQVDVNIEPRLALCQPFLFPLLRFFLVILPDLLNRARNTPEKAQKRRPCNQHDEGKNQQPGDNPRADLSTGSQKRPANQTGSKAASLLGYAVLIKFNTLVNKILPRYVAHT